MAKRKLSAAALDELEAAGIKVTRPKPKKPIAKPAEQAAPATNTQELIDALTDIPQQAPTPPMPTLAPPAVDSKEIATVIKQGFAEVSDLMQGSADIPKPLPSVVECEVDILGREKEFPHQATGYRIRFTYPN